MFVGWVFLIKYQGQMHGTEVKSYTDKFGYATDCLEQVARYGQSLGLTEITLAFFIETIDDDSRQKYEAVYVDEEIGVLPVFVAMGGWSSTS